MFGFGNKQAPRVNDLERQLQNLESIKLQLEQRVKQLEEKIACDTRAADCDFDFDNMNVFSVERNDSKGEPCTIIGYLLDEPVLSSDGEMIVNKPVVREWYYYCDLARHQQVVDAFRKSKKTK